MKQNRQSRGRFLQRALAASAVVVGGYEEALLHTRAAQPAPSGRPGTPPREFPKGRIGKVSISRLICGGNLISGFAHSRDLIYVSSLLKNYFTDARVWETLQRCEQEGIDTAILRLDDNTLRILRGYWKEHGGRIQWIAQVKITAEDGRTEAQRAIDAGAVGAYVHGGVGDDFVQRGQVDRLAQAVDFIRSQGVVAGVAGHALDVPKACEKAGVKADFFMKTFNSKQYWSAGPMPRHDSVWEETPQETAAFMQDVDKPWIAYKVLGAGAIHPREGFQYAFQNGADFICVGMFDFQVAEDAALARLALEKSRQRNRTWWG